MRKRKIALIAALTVILTSISVVAADEAGIFTINIFDSPNSTLYTDISNSTIHGQTNYTNSNAVENITLTNSTLTLSINGQNITITSQGDNLTINAPNQTTTTINPAPTTNTDVPLLTLSFMDSEAGSFSMTGGNSTYHQYTFDITVGVPTSMNYLFGKNVTHEVLNTALTPLVVEYNLATRTENHTGTVNTVVTWVATQIVGGESHFSLYSRSNLSDEQIQMLTLDLYDAFALAMSGKL